MQDQKRKLYEYLCGFISDERRNKFERYIESRTRYVTIAVEDIYQPHNISAVLRSAECFGIQDVHVIENANKFSPNPDVSLGSNKWLTLHHYRGKENNSLDCIQQLKKNGYRIVATTPHEKDQFISELDLSKGKVALFFGTELEGISKTVIDNADEFVKIPMFGFTESFNISVSTAICDYELTERLRKSAINWRLSEEEKTDILLEWARNSVQKPELLEKEFLKK
ncbi:MAG TPA: RNA methyltransferase [Bacteroidia bacterium]|jgi:tRNA (guanosine-2'-O-)-methyltransferase|nr:RNA methyltransferase [Bacteroidia bacterium]